MCDGSSGPLRLLPRQTRPGRPPPAGVAEGVGDDERDCDQSRDFNAAHVGSDHTLGRLQSGVGRSTESITSTSTGLRDGSSFKPSCS
jgi:hypothetical protein